MTSAISLILSTSLSILISGAPSGGFFQNTLKTLFRLSKVLLDLCSVIPGELKSSKLQGLQCYFAGNFRCNSAFYESENFSDSSFYHILESKNFRFPFSKIV